MMNELQVFGCDWFKYTNPPLPILSNQLEKCSEDFVDLDQVEGLKALSLRVSIQSASNVQKITFIDFLTHFSQGNFTINWRDYLGRSPLHNAVMSGDMTTVDLLL
jgi:ankyrin repeat protein